MARFHGKVGYAHTVDKGVGVYAAEITERSYFGDVVRPSRRVSDDDKVNSDVTAGHAISIVADSYATENIFAIRFVEWSGACWKVTHVENQRPRLILTLGGVYNGPKAPVPSGP
jgi:hypothetical protein